MPRQSRPFDLAVRWEFKPTASQTMIEVQEPKLEMRLDGPKEVYFGKKETFTLKLANTGTGSAENLAIKLTPVGSGDNVPATYPLGILPAGEEKNIEVELVARQSGILENPGRDQGRRRHPRRIEREDSRCAGGLGNRNGRTQAAIRRRQRDLPSAGPQSRQRPGEKYRLDRRAPAGREVSRRNRSAALSADGAKLQWTVDSLGPEAVQTFAVKCNLGSEGVNRLDIAAAAEDELAAAAQAVTQVEAVANLTLDVKDPGGPVPVGEEAVYEIHIRNRGTKDADNVEVAGRVSLGVEPVSAEGGENRMVNGQVLFAPLPRLAGSGGDLQS